MAFHPYPQVIPSVFNRSGFGPPQSLTSASACPWIDHPASRLRLATDRHLKGSLSLRLGSRLNLAANRNSLAHSTKGTPSQRMAAPTACRHTVSGTVSLPSRGAFHLSLTVLFAIGHRRVLSLGGWSPQIHTGFHVSGITRDPSLGPAVLRVRGSHPVSPGFPAGSPGPRVSDPTPPLQRRDGGSHYPTCGNAWRLTRARV